MFIFTFEATLDRRQQRVSLEVCGMLLLFLGVDKINFSDISLLVQCDVEFRNIFSHQMIPKYFFL